MTTMEDVFKITMDNLKKDWKFHSYAALNRPLYMPENRFDAIDVDFEVVEEPKALIGVGK